MGLTNVSLSSAEATVCFGNGSLNWTLCQNGTLPSNSPSFEQESLVFRVFKVLAYVTVIILSLVGNSLTIGTVYQNVINSANANSEQPPDCQSKHRGFAHHSL